MINRKHLYNYKSGGVRATEREASRSIREPQFMPQVAKVDKAKPKLNMNLMRDFNISDIEGLKRAYASKSGAYIHGNRMYVAGARNGRDVWDDITKVPFSLTRHSDRFKSVKKVLDENPQVEQLIGHSLAGAVVQDLNKDNGMRFITRSYNAPIVSFQQSGETGGNYRIRDKKDLVSAFDRGAITVDRNKPNPLDAHFLQDFNDVGMKPQSTPITPEEITDGLKNNLM